MRSNPDKCYHLAIVIVGCDSLTQQRNLDGIQVHETSVTIAPPEIKARCWCCYPNRGAITIPESTTVPTCACVQTSIGVGVVRWELLTGAPQHRIVSCISRISSCGQRIVCRRTADRESGILGIVPSSIAVLQIKTSPAVSLSQLVQSVQPNPI